jgi:malonyl-CoA/methylmalonyl-CoA synthetase
LHGKTARQRARSRGRQFATSVARSRAAACHEEPNAPGRFGNFASGTVRRRALIHIQQLPPPAYSHGPGSLARPHAPREDLTVLFPALTNPTDKLALRFGDARLDYAQLRGAATHVADRVKGADRVGVWAVPAPETCVAALGALLAGVALVPINPKAGERELGHIVADSDPGMILCVPGADLPAALAARPRVDVDLAGRGGDVPPEPPDDAPAIVIYTSGTTGPPKGAVLPRRSIASNLDALADAWEWTEADVVAHGLPLFHVHGLILGVLGPIRRGGTAYHLGRFSSAAVAAALDGDATMLFAVPTMYHRLAADAEADPQIARALGKARLLVSGSAALPAAEHSRLERLTGQRIVERYGMTETLMNTAIRASGDRRPGYVGPALGGIEIRLVDDEGNAIDDADDETVGEITVRGPNLFLEYLNRPDATAEAMRDGWFLTGDLATRAPDGYIRIVGRRATDLIKSGGFKIGAGEIEGALIEHPDVQEAAVTGEPDPDLGERIVAWIVPRPGASLSPDELSHHVAGMLTPHKRPRVVHFLTELPRNEMGKVQKRRLEVPARTPPA